MNKGSLHAWEKTRFIERENDMNRPKTNNRARFLVSFRTRKMDKNVKQKESAMLNQRANEM